VGGRKLKPPSNPPAADAHLHPALLVKGMGLDTCRHLSLNTELNN